MISLVHASITESVAYENTAIIAADSRKTSPTSPLPTYSPVDQIPAPNSISLPLTVPQINATAIEFIKYALQHAATSAISTISSSVASNTPWIHRRVKQFNQNLKKHWTNTRKSTLKYYRYIISAFEDEYMVLRQADETRMLMPIRSGPKISNLARGDLYEAAIWGPRSVPPGDIRAWEPPEDEHIPFAVRSIARGARSLARAGYPVHRFVKILPTWGEEWWGAVWWRAKLIYSIWSMIPDAVLVIMLGWIIHRIYRVLSWLR